jgi:hypothetical protein
MSGVRRFFIRLWVHEAEDGFVPEATVVAATALEAAALALRDFESMGRLLTPDGYLECEPRGDAPLRVKDVMAWRETEVGAAFLRRPDTASVEC